eukprot:TRINITY_DN6607_c1_g1_i2.p1 TRINITY_DN6607_c1_g1~~TRINITY_DN6607_c1_g1_i2.p1  ORF type:complete len:467 (+),score=49.69 TRINITY_DN6607_c1_g1_i2:55-1455(+)
MYSVICHKCNHVFEDPQVLTYCPRCQEICTVNDPEAAAVARNDVAPPHDEDSAAFIPDYGAATPLNEAIDSYYPSPVDHAHFSASDYAGSSPNGADTALHSYDSRSAPETPPSLPPAENTPPKLPVPFTRRPLEVPSAAAQPQQALPSARTRPQPSAAAWPKPLLPTPLTRAPRDVPQPRVRVRRGGPFAPPPHIRLPPAVDQPNLTFPTWNDVMTMHRKRQRPATPPAESEHPAKRAAAASPAADKPKPLLVKSQKAVSIPNTSVWKTITNKHSLLLIGEGNFSFAHALAKRIGSGRGIIATDVEAHHELLGRAGCDSNVAPLLRMGACIHCGTDVTKLSTDSPWKTRHGSFDVMSWAFPHTRTPNRDNKCIPEHRHLLRSFIKECAVLLKPGAMGIITVKEGWPYNNWDVAGLATEEMEYAYMEPFFPRDFPEYRHVTTIGAPIMKITPATTHIFRRVSGGAQQ